jgi:hypothetical protein
MAVYLSELPTNVVFGNKSLPLQNLELEIVIKDGSGDILGDKGDVVNTTMCLFKNTIQTYTDCCTDSSVHLCDYLMIMFFACFVIYAGIFIYITNKKTWLKDQGMYINVFSFQLCVLLCKKC